MPKSTPAVRPYVEPPPQPHDLYRGHGSWLLRILSARFGAQAAEDLCQEAYLRAAQSKSGWTVSPRAWLLRIALNVAFEERRRARVRCPDALAGDPLESCPPLPCPPEQDAQLLLKQIVLDLPPKLQDVFVLSRFEGLTTEEIARRCGVSTKTVEWRMTKALAICAARLRD